MAKCVPPSHGRRVLFGLAPILSGYGVDIVPLFIGHGPPSYAGTREAIRRCSWPSVALRSCALETEMLLHRREISVVMQQRVSMLAESADDDAGGLADRDAQFSQLAAVPSGARGQIGTQQRHNHILTQSTLNMRGMGLVPCALEDFEQDEVADQPRLSCRLPPAGGRQRSIAAQMRDPDGAVDKNHDQATGRASRIASKSPSQPNPLSSAIALVWPRT